MVIMLYLLGGEMKGFYPSCWYDMIVTGDGWWSGSKAEREIGYWVWPERFGDAKLLSWYLRWLGQMYVNKTTKIDFGFVKRVMKVRVYTVVYSYWSQS